MVAEKKEVKSSEGESRSAGVLVEPPKTSDHVSVTFLSPDGAVRLRMSSRRASSSSSLLFVLRSSPTCKSPISKSIGSFTEAPV